MPAIQDSLQCSTSYALEEGNQVWEGATLLHLQVGIEATWHRPTLCLQLCT